MSNFELTRIHFINELKRSAQNHNTQMHKYEILHKLKAKNSKAKRFSLYISIRAHFIVVPYPSRSFSPNKIH